MRTHARPILVVVCGNENAGEDALGPRVARELADMNLSGVDIVDLAMKPAALFDLLAGRELLLIVDAIATPSADEAWKVVVCSWSDCRNSVIRGANSSTHGLSIGDQLLLAEQLGMLPLDVRFVGCTVGMFELGTPASELFVMAVRRLAERVFFEIHQYRAAEHAHA